MPDTLRTFFLGIGGETGNEAWIRRFIGEIEEFEETASEAGRRWRMGNGSNRKTSNIEHRMPEASGTIAHFVGARARSRGLRYLKEVSLQNCVYRWANCKFGSKEGRIVRFYWQI